MRYPRISSDSIGESHFSDVELETRPAIYAPPAPPFDVSEYLPATRVVFALLPEGWYGDLHPAPHRQFAFVLAGEVEVRASDGETRSLTAGDVLFMEDTTGRGHATRNVARGAVSIAFVQV